MMWSFKNYRPTGVYANVGDTIEVYVDVEPGKPAPQLIIHQQEPQHNGLHAFNLQQGKNVIKVPELNGTGEIREDTPLGGPIYLNS